MITFLAKHRSRLSMVTMIAMLVLLIAMPGVSAQNELVLVIGHAEGTDSLDPANGFTQTTGFINHVTYDTLVTFPDDSAGSIEPQLATDWSISDDGLTYTFTLREDITFWNGDPLTAADVVFTYTRLQNLNGNPSFLADNIASVEADGDYTVIITLTEPSPPFLSLLPSYVFGITNASLVMENGGTGDFDTDTAEEFLNDSSAGTGPYILESWEPQVETVLVRNENYWGEQPYFDRVIIVNIAESATQKVALESGDIDLALDLTADQVVSMEGNADITLYREPGNITHFVFMNADPDVSGPFADPTVQLAVRYALDYEGYKTLWGGSTPGTNMSTILAGAYGEDKAFVRDIDRAKELLVEAGYPDGLEVTLQYPDFEFQGVNMNTNAQKIQFDLAEVGITVTLEPSEMQVSLEQYRNGEQAFAYWFWGPDLLDPADFLSFLPGGKVADERVNWTEDRVDSDLLDLIAAASTESNAETRADLFDQLQDYMQQSGPYGPYLVQNVQTAYRADIQGYVWHPQWLLDVALLSRAE